jgi:two-component system OmpR family response regulator
VDAETGTVVVIEDDPHIADLVDLYLRRDGNSVLLARDGDQGLRIINQEDPWIVILDVGLPGQLDGFDVCREIRAKGNLPVLFLTARDDEVDRILGLELGADDYLAKPFSPRELVARVRAILRRTRDVPAPQEIISVASLNTWPDRCRRTRRMARNGAAHSTVS